ncbi:hypothetical protein [Acinetobacter chinensis]|uniref:hypothetical protein n=1 Tax=Acinetobacter chinensis TaxID=2004650 RepID=UPI002934CBC9|nr:hypothetical protein [Acinetobacter chinensis]WOE40097.1 hypothetical protein QSG87_09240 [Acinetobacter chinensis]
MNNLTEHQCQGKCPEYKGEQCRHCLVQHVEKREFNIGIDLAADGEDKSVQLAYCAISKKHCSCPSGVQVCLHEHGGAVVEVLR